MLSFVRDRLGSKIDFMAHNRSVYISSVDLAHGALFDGFISRIPFPRYNPNSKALKKKKAMIIMLPFCL